MNINQRRESFLKTGEEFKKVLLKKIETLKMRLEKRNIILEEELNDKQRLRSYLLRSAEPSNQGSHRGNLTGHFHSYGQEHIGIEEVEEIKHLCSRIFQIEEEIKTYEIIRNNLKDKDSIELTIQELM